MRVSLWFRLGCGVLAANLLNCAASAADWYSLGPFGGDAGSLATDPANSRHIYLGTVMGWVYDSHDGGTTWNRVSQLEKRNDLVIKQITVDAENPKRLIVGAYSVNHPDGGIFVSHDYGRSWQIQADMRGQSIRSLARAPSNPNELVAGTMTGIFRTLDNGEHWKQISPEGSTELHEVESIAIDPSNPNVIYAGTWHLAWKTTDGGATWFNIKEGMIDDSDVFSIIVTPKQSDVVYASACSGIYKSMDAGKLFEKLQGIPSTARRTRKLAQDPQHMDTVFAGTTEGLYRTVDGGQHWDLVTRADVVVNDVSIDPANPEHILIATDRGGVYRSEDGGMTFEASNQGFSARQVLAYAADPQNAQRVYVGVANGSAAGGAFQSADGGVTWTQQSDGLSGRDVLSLLSLNDGTLLAGTGHGIFRLQGRTWSDSSSLEVSPAEQLRSEPPRKTVRDPQTTRLVGQLRREAPPEKPRAMPIEPKGRQSQEHPARTLRLAAGVAATGHARLIEAPKIRFGKRHLRASAPTRLLEVKRAAIRPLHPGQTANPADPARIDGAVYCLVSSGRFLFAGSSEGLLKSDDAGRHWSSIRSLRTNDVHFVSVLQPAGDDGGDAAPLVMAASLQQLALSGDNGAGWSPVALPPELTRIGAVVIDGDKNLWVGGREGVWLSTDYGNTWKTLRNLYLTEVNSIFYDSTGHRVLLASSNSSVAFAVNLPDHKVNYWESGWKLRFVRPVGSHLIGATLFDGVVVQPGTENKPAVSTSGSSK